MAKTLRNTEFDAVFHDISSEGFGVCTAPDGRTLFASGALPEEKARVKIIKEYKSYLIGRVEELYHPSPYRIEPDCTAYTRCGGCSFRHVDYKEELRFKQSFVKNAFARNAGRTDIEVKFPIHGNPEEYRNKLLLPIAEKDGKLFCGFYAKHSHSVIPCDACKLHTKDFSLIQRDVLALLEGNSVYNEETGKGLLRHLYLRRTREGDFGVCVVINGNALPRVTEIADRLTEKHPQIKSFYVNINKERTNTVTGKDWVLIKGEPTLTDTICGKRFVLSPASFFQVNAEMTEKLFSTAAALADIKDGDTVFDLYCGVGSVGLCICPDSATLCGVEIVPQAVENADLNAFINGRREENTRFFCGDAAKGFAACREAFGKSPRVVLVDPPRAGLSEALIEEIAKVAPEKVVYVSCNPATLARDVKRFSACGYGTNTAYTVDMFPRTVHVESVVCLTRSDKAT